MNQLLQNVKAVLPYRSRRFLWTAPRGFVFQRAMKRFLRDPEACTHPENPIILDLIYGWGNTYWSGLGEYLTGCIGHALTSRGPILECGSGLSTLLVGAVAKQRGYTHWVLEHMPEWAMEVQRYLEKYYIDSVVLCSKPLKDYGDYCWYEPPLQSMPDSFSLVICDGPPGSSTKGGRYGLVPVMRERLKPGCIILLDDAAREQESAIARRWETELGASSKFLGAIKPYIEMVVIDG